MVLNRQAKKSILGIVLNRIEHLSNFWRVFLLKNFGIQIDYSSQVSAHVQINLGTYQNQSGQVYIGEKVKLCQGVLLNCWGGSIMIERNVFIGPYTVVYGRGNVKIGQDSLIAMHCRIISSNHAIPDSHTLIRSQPNISLPVTIGKDVWLGAGVTILGGVTVGDGCVVGAGAVVTKDLPPYSVAVGIPAKVIKKRSQLTPSIKSQFVEENNLETIQYL